MDIIEEKEPDVFPCETAEGQEDCPVKPPVVKKVDGWLAFLLLMTGIGAALAVVRLFIGLDMNSYDIGIGRWGIFLGICADVISIVGLLILAIYTIASSLKFKPNAIPLAKSYLIIVFIINLTILLNGIYAAQENGIGNLVQLIRSLIWGVVWFIYLCCSKRVNELFPKPERKMFVRDKVLLIIIVLPILCWYLLCFSIGMLNGAYY